MNDKGRLFCRANTDKLHVFEINLWNITIITLVEVRYYEGDRYFLS